MNTIETIAYTLLGLLAASTVWLVADNLIRIIRLSRQIRAMKKETQPAPDFSKMTDRELDWWVEQQLHAQDEAEGFRYDPSQDYWDNDHVTCWDDVPEVIASDCTNATTSKKP